MARAVHTRRARHVAIFGCLSPGCRCRHPARPRGGRAALPVPSYRLVRRRAAQYSAPGFLKWGALRYVGKHYLKFQDGPYWLRAGTDEPEDFLGYAGFERTPAKHHYAAHEEDWHEGDPDWGDGKGRAIIGASITWPANMSTASIS